MQIQYISEFKSISRFDPYEIPDFTLITGLNGSGKTHLLEAISKGCIHINEYKHFAIQSNSVKYYDYTTLMPNTINQAESHQVLPYEYVISQTTLKLNTIKESIRKTFELKGLNFNEEYFDIKKLELTEKFELLDASNDVKIEIKNSIEQLIRIHLNDLKSSISNVINISNLSNGEILNLSYEDSIKIKPINRCDDIFQQSFSRIFLQYFELEKINQMIKLDKLTSKDKYLNKKQFIKTHGEPPWDVANEVFKTAELGFYLTKPESYLQNKFSTKLIKISNNKEVQFVNLSSGEKILISFALCLINSRDDNSGNNKPKLLLLDEVDASLHPKMSKQLLNVVIENIVKKQEIKVIMTTHSPSTIAMSPDDAIYAKIEDDPKLHKINKNDAINILTSGIPTLSIDINNRKNVFVESKNDEERYSSIYNKLKDKFESPFSLNFIAIGSKKTTGEDIGGGCNNVIKIVEALRSSGNKNIFGLIDWDKNTRRIEKSYIQVLGNKKWYSIENCILDPLVLLIFLLKKSKGITYKYTKLKEIHCNNLLDKDISIIQSSVNRLQSEILGKEISTDKNDQINFKYMGGITLAISKCYAHYNGHELSKLVTSKIPPLNGYEKNIDNLLKEIIDKVFTEHEDAIPFDVINDFSQILEK